MRLIYIFILLFLSSFLFAQQTDFIATNVNPSYEDSTISYKWQVGISTMFNEHRSDIYQNKFIDLSNLENGLNFSLSRTIFNNHLVSLNLNKIKLKYSHTDSINSMSDVYDPYRLYQNKGYSFSSDILALNFKTNIDLENLFNLDFESFINKVNKSKKLNETINLYFDIGFGLTYFSSISRNIPSGNYIYSYGYKDEEGSPEEIKSITERPISNLFLLGYTIKYKAKTNIFYFFSWEEVFVDTDMLDGISNSTKQDRYRSLHLGVNYLF